MMALEAMLKRGVYKVLRSDGTILNNPYISGKLVPLQGKGAHCILMKPSSNGSSNGDLPVPPRELWAGYGSTPEEYLALGREHMGSMLDILQKAGAAPSQLLRVLEFGCAAARMLRFYPYTPGASEIWGVDIESRHISWCQQHLSPPFLFATTTTMPHLPFEDNYFDLVYCGSVFTHISDLADAWFLELRRVLRKGGYAYITIHDEHTVKLLLEKGIKPELVDAIRELDQTDALLSQDYACFWIAETPSYPLPNVFYNSEYITRKWSKLAKILSINREAYGYQTALLIQK